MKDEFHTLLPSPEAYLKRIGIDASRAASLMQRVRAEGRAWEEGKDKMLLDELILRHHLSVPFENLDICLWHRPVRLDIDSLFDKIVVRRRGGYCFELNGLFTQLLEELGYEVRSIACRITRNMTVLRPCLHRAILVRTGGAWHYCDVGFGGPMPACAVPLDAGPSECPGHEFFEARPLDEFWWSLLRMKDAKAEEAGREEILQFSLFPQSRVEFMTANAWCSDPSFVFAARPMINLRTAEGYLAVNGSVFTECRGGVKTETALEGEAELLPVLERRFGLKKD